MSKDDWERNSLMNLFDLPEAESILDVACGLSLKSKYIPAVIRVGVDLHSEYFKAIESDMPYVVIKYDVRRLQDLFVDKSFDIVIACDIVEHLEKQEALEMLRQCERIARKAVVIETPKGYVPQNLDILGFGAHELQTHRSSWECEDFEALGYRTLTRPYTMSDTKRHTDVNVDPHIQIIDAIKYV